MLSDIQLKAKEVSFFALQVDDAHARFMRAYFDGNMRGQLLITKQHALLHRRYNRAVTEYEALKNHAK